VKASLKPRLHQRNKQLVARNMLRWCKRGISVNTEKTNVMMLSKDRMEITITINDQQLQQVTSFVYLGSMLQENGDREMGIRKILGMGRSAMQSLSNFWKSRI